MTAPTVSAGAALGPRSLTKLWCKIAGSFLAASALQILFYGAPAIFRFGGYHVTGGMHLPVVLAFFFAPALGAMVYSLRSATLLYRRSGSVVPMFAIAGIVFLALASAYMGVFVSFNTWGT